MLTVKTNGYLDLVMDFMNRVMGKRVFCICENKGAYLLRELISALKSKAQSNTFFLYLRLNPRGGRQTGIPVYQVLKGVIVE